MGKQSLEQKQDREFITLTPSKVKPLDYANQTIIFPVIGEATLSNKGTLDVAVEQVELLIEATRDAFGFYEHVEGKKESGKAKSNTQQYNEEYAKTKAELDSLELVDLVALAKDSGFDAAALMNMTDGKIKSELLKKLVPDNK
jgi:hypothetical protein